MRDISRFFPGEIGRRISGAELCPSPCCGGCTNGQPFVPNFPTLELDASMKIEDGVEQPGVNDSREKRSSEPTTEVEDGVLRDKHARVWSKPPVRAHVEEFQAAWLYPGGKWEVCRCCPRDANGRL